MSNCGWLCAGRVGGGGAPALAYEVGIKLLIGSVSENAEGGEGDNVRRVKLAEAN